MESSHDRNENLILEFVMMFTDGIQGQFFSIHERRNFLRYLIVSYLYRGLLSDPREHL